MILVLLGITSLSADDFIPTKAFVTCLSFHAAERIKSCSLCSHLVRNNTKTWSQRLQLSPILSEERVTVCKMQREISDWNKIFFKNYMVKKKQSESSADVRLQWQELLPYSGGISVVDCRQTGKHKNYIISLTVLLIILLSF